MKRLSVYFLFLLSTTTGIYAQKLESFPLSSVKLLQSPFKEAQSTDMNYILTLEPDRLLAPYLREAGIEPLKTSYGNWENTGLDGHIGGHYLSALSFMYAATGNPELKQRIDYMLGWLEKCQQKNGDGYIGGVPGGRAMWKEIASGKINAGSFSLNNKWVPLYNIHKLFAGLIDVYNNTGSEQAKKILINYADWAYKLTSNLTERQMQDMLRSEHGGMNEVFADVAGITGDKKYLDLARKFSHRLILDPLLQSKDMLTGLHANTQIPKVIGFMRVAEISGDTTWARAADFFWNTVVDHRTVSIGGNSVREHFHPADNFSSMIESREGPETCNSYNMLKLTRHLFLSSPSASYMDYYERTLYNHILSSQRPGGGFVYFTPMRPQHYRVYSQPQDGFWCCVGSGLENHGKYGELIYAHNAGDLYINLFIASSLEWKKKGLKLVQNTSFPYSETSEIKLDLKKSGQFAINLRYPSWIEKGKMKVLINNKEQVLKPDTNQYLNLSRKWKTGDVISVTMPMSTRAEFMPDHSAWVSFVHGPIVLAAATDKTGLSGLLADGSRMGHIAGGPLIPLEEAPMIVSSGQDFASSVQPVNPSKLIFKASSLIYQDKFKELELVPFYSLHDTRYMVYWPYTSSDKLAGVLKNMQEKEAEKLKLENMTVDLVISGEQQPESDHNFKGEATETGIFQERHFRNAKKWFSYDMKNNGLAAKKLRIVYYGKERNRNFKIYINNMLLDTVKLDGSGANQFVDADFIIPVDITKNSPVLEVKFSAEDGSSTAGIYEVRLLKN